jgi:hypothetical protein
LHSHAYAARAGAPRGCNNRHGSGAELEAKVTREQRKSEVVMVRFTRAQYDEMEAAAARAGMALSAYLREAALGAPKAEEKLEALAARVDRIEAFVNGGRVQ